MFTNRIDFEIWEYNNCKTCLKRAGCPIRQELSERGIAPELKKHGLSYICTAQERPPSPWQN